MRKFIFTTFILAVFFLNAEAWQLAESNNKFALDIYNQTSLPTENYIFSPLSISSALAMTFGGAAGITEQEMRKVLYFSDDNNLVHQSFANFISDYQKLNSEKVEVQLANSLWIQEDYKLRKSFLELMEKYYDSKLFKVNYKTEPQKSADRINSWVEKITKEKIKNIIKPNIITSATKLILCNAIYLKAEWRDQFEERFTKPGKFWLDKESSMQTPMMLKIDYFQLATFDNMKVVQLPYAGSDLAMTILLPNDVDGIDELENELDPDLFSKINEQLKTKRVRIFLPKFKIETTLNLNETLINLGMTSAFSASANFSKMEKTNSLAISDVVHKAFIEIDENGTEAAAATVVMMSAMCIPEPAPIVDFNANHPFFFYIQDTKSKTILFMGKVMKPNKFQEIK